MKAHVEVAGFHIHRPKPAQPAQLGGQTANPEAHVEVASFQLHRPKAHLARSARWPNSEREPTSKWPAFIYIDQSPPSPLSQVVKQQIRKPTSKWPAFAHRSKPAQPAQLGGPTANSKAHVEVASFHTQIKARLARSARWSNSEFGSPRQSGQLSHTQTKGHLPSRWPNENSEAHVEVASFHNFELSI